MPSAVQPYMTFCERSIHSNSLAAQLLLLKKDAKCDQLDLIFSALEMTAKQQLSITDLYKFYIFKEMLHRIRRYERFGCHTPAIKDMASKWLIFQAENLIKATNGF